MARTLSLKGEWKPGLAGGCPKYETYGANPSFILAPSTPASFTIELTQPADAPARLPIGLVILNRDPSQPFQPKLSSKRLQAKTNYKASLSQSLTINLEPAAADRVQVGSRLGEVLEAGTRRVGQLRRVLPRGGAVGVGERARHPVGARAAM